MNTESDEECYLAGFEGAWPATSLLTWGAAAIRQGDKIINAVTRLSYFDKEFLKDDAACKFSSAIPLKPTDCWYKSYVALINEKHPHSTYLPVINKNNGVLLNQLVEEQRIVLFSDCEAFDTFASSVVASVRDAIFSLPPDDNQVTKLLKTAFILDCKNPTLNALKVFLANAEQKMVAIQLAEANVGSEQVKRLHEEIKALTKWK